MLNNMKNKELFIKALSTLFFSFGSNAPSEVFWGANEMLDWYEAEYNITLGIRFEDSNGEDIEEVSNFDDVKIAILNS